MGLLYYDTSNNRYLVFADEHEKDSYLQDPTQNNLVLGVFEAPFNYSAEVYLSTSTYNAVFVGNTGNYIDFTFDIKNKQGQSTNESVICTYTFRRGSVVKTAVEQYAAGRAVHFNIDKYIAEGANTITIGIQGVTTLAATTVAITYQVINLSLSADYNIANVFDLSGGAKTLEVPFTVAGYGTKVVEWYLDGEKLDFEKDTDEVVDLEATRTKYILLSNLAQGVHSLQVRASTTINGEAFYSDVLYREIMVYTGVSNDILVAMEAIIPTRVGIINGRKLYGVTQYVPYTLRFATYNPTASNTNVEVKLGNTTQGVVKSANAVVNEVTIATTKAGLTNVTFVIGDSTVDIPTDVTPTQMKISEITEGLQLNFRALGKSNNATDKDSWSYGDYKGTFTGFNWNGTSGWVDNTLYVSAGASFGIDYAPLANNPTDKGKTIEVEFMTTNVNDDNAIICDLRNGNGTGLVITATKVTLTSEAGVTIETPFKDGEFIRVGFVINKAVGSTNKCMAFIYVNGKYARGTSWAVTDSYTSDKELLFTGSEAAEVKIKQILIYDAALTTDQMLNNRILYTDNIAEMNDIYERNDVYGEGTTFDPEKMSGRLPVMIITGDIPVLENTTDKNEQIIVDIEYTNLQDPSRSFVWKGAALRPQGTSSMGYPKKNFRPYTKKVDSTICYDAQGKIVKDKLYAFKDKAQRVDCWCLKADYAESSGAHNTGIARLWNDILVNATIEGEYVFRTEAQKIAIANEFGYDVRTTIDGFPILLFYRPTKDDDLIFIGKYNFNNDKSTPSVFGFEGIEGFDNSKMQCWEVLNNGNDLALFKTADGFDTGWKEAFESRYPDTKTPDTQYLKSFCQWMSNVSQENFATEKWEHLDIYKVAAYYIYLMRFGAVDQTVKNSMFTTEDGVKWYFINYDNDTILGLTNEGKLVVPWDVNRETIGGDGEPYYAGPDSRLWNMLEADEEFMTIVRNVDEALYTAGLRYDDVISMFDDKQSGKWVERVYNQDAQYKYVGPWVEKGINNLFMLQGDRATHRKYWLARRFALYDAMFVSGAYKAQCIEVKCINNTEEGQQIKITAGTGMDYGYGINNVPREANISLLEGEEYTFTTEETVNLGDPIRVYGAPNIKGIDLSQMSDRLAVVDISKAYDKSLGSKLTHLILGGDKVNNSVEAISGLSQCTKLEYLDVRNMRLLKSLDLTAHQNLSYVDTRGSDVSSILFKYGGALQEVKFSAAMKNLTLEQLPYISWDKLQFEAISALSTVSVKSCPKVSNNFSLIKQWIENKTTPDADCVLIMDNINWNDIAPADLIKVGQLGTISLKGRVKLTEISEEYVNILGEIFGADAFDKNAEFYIDAPPAVFLQGRTELVEGESETYKVIVFGAEITKLTMSASNLSGASFNAETGVLTTIEAGYRRDITISAIVYTTKGSQTVSTTVRVSAKVYPTSGTISGANRIENAEETYTLEYSTEGVNGEYTTVWTLTGFDGYAEIKSSNRDSCVVKKLNEATTTIQGTIKCQAKKANGSSLFTATKTIEMLNENIAETDPGVCAALYSVGLCANESYVTKDEAARVTANDLQPGTSTSTSLLYAFRSKLKSFDGFRHFIGVTEIKDQTFRSCSNLKSITIPDTVVTIGRRAFQDCTSLISVTIPDSVTTILYYAFYNCGLTTITIPDSVTIIDEYSFQSCSKLISVTIPDSVTNIKKAAFYQCRALTSVTIGNSVTTIEAEAFSFCTSLTSVTIGNGVTSIGEGAFSGCNSLTSVIIPDSVTSIGDSAFNYCSSLVEFKGKFASEDSRCLVIGGKLHSFAPSGITEYTIHDGITEIGASAFYQCSNLISVTIPDSVTKIGSSAFSYCTSLTSVTIGKRVTSIGSSAFNYCSSLTSIAIPDAVTTIGYGAFINCRSLTSITIPDSVTTIGGQAFGGCNLLEKATIGNGVTSLESNLFSGCINLSKLTFKSIVAPTVNSSAFGTSTTSYTGYATRGQNVLYVPANSTGYETGYWLDPLCNADKCGFTLSKTL